MYRWRIIRIKIINILMLPNYFVMIHQNSSMQINFKLLLIYTINLFTLFYAFMVRFYRFKN